MRLNIWRCWIGFGDGDKYHVAITNWLGGEYYLTADEVYTKGNHIVIQESKNVSASLFPALDDIRDGLFKLILYANMDQLTVDGVARPFVVRLKITGQFRGRLQLPTTDAAVIEAFLMRSSLKARQQRIVYLLNEEASVNQRLQILLVGSDASTG